MTTNAAIIGTATMLGRILLVMMVMSVQMLTPPDTTIIEMEQPE